MGIKIVIECDARGCGNSTEMNDWCDSDVEHAGYHPDPRHEDTHYCHGCWPKIQAEEAELEAEK